jgi:hypothetical protein|tara:strand:- start:244 stop:426 length:183 start_codon:yes stop_codon:yes gene_type:complete
MDHGKKKMMGGGYNMMMEEDKKKPRTGAAMGRMMYGHGGKASADIYAMEAACNKMAKRTK